jgi:ketosteroid isomerase-like protein
MDLLDRVLALWSEPLPADDEAAAARFRELYTDPVTVNGVLFEASALAGRARAQQRAFSDMRLELIDRIDVPGKLVIVFRQIGRHVGPLSTPLGEVAATGKVIERQVMDVLTLQGERIVDVRVLGDDLGMLSRLDVVRLKLEP